MMNSQIKAVLVCHPLQNTQLVYISSLPCESIGLNTNICALLYDLAYSEAQPSPKFWIENTFTNTQLSEMTHSLSLYL